MGNLKKGFVLKVDTCLEKKRLSLGVKIGLLFFSGQPSLCTEKEVETQTEKADVSEVVLAPDQEIVTDKRTPSAEGNGCLAGVTVHRAHTETMTTTTTTRMTKTLIAGMIDLWIGLRQKSLLWATSTMAKSAVLCSLAVLCN